MADDLEKQVAKNTTAIEVFKSSSEDTLRGLTRICDTMDKDRIENKETFDKIGKSFSDIDKLLRGKDADNPGLVVKVDRLEHYSKRIKGVIGTLITAMIAMGATVLSWALGLFGKGN